MSTTSADKSILRRLYIDEEIIVGPTTGIETIANAGNIFTGFLDSDFKNWGTDKPSGVVTKPTPAEVYELHKKATFRQILVSFGREIDLLCWEQGQIINFCHEHRDKLHPEGWMTFFIFKSEGFEEPVVVPVRSAPGELKATAYQFDFPFPLNAEHRYRVVVPQLET